MTYQKLKLCHILFFLKHFEKQSVFHYSQWAASHRQPVTVSICAFLQASRLLCFAMSTPFCEAACFKLCNSYVKSSLNGYCQEPIGLKPSSFIPDEKRVSHLASHIVNRTTYSPHRVKWTYPISWYFLLWSSKYVTKLCVCVCVRAPHKFHSIAIYGEGETDYGTHTHRTPFEI
jgi:hypothetical protein